jgi:hypothetical protein
MPTGELPDSAAGWSLLLPDNWYHLRLNPGRQRQVHTLLLQLLANLPRDTVFPWRRELEQQVNSFLDDAVADGASDVYLLVDSRYGLPLAATCLASLVPIPMPSGVPAAVVAQTLAGRAADQPGVLMIEGQECAAIRRTESTVIENDGSGAGEFVPATLPVSGLDVFIPVPSDPVDANHPGGVDDRGHTLLLSFRTPVAPVAEPMVTLFEAIAESLRWTWEDT